MNAFPSPCFPSQDPVALDRVALAAAAEDRAAQAQRATTSGVTQPGATQPGATPSDDAGQSGRPSQQDRVARADADSVAPLAAPDQQPQVGAPASTARRGATRAVRAGLVSDTAHGAVVPPIYLSSNFIFAGLDQPRPYDYTRSGNPTRDQLAAAVAAAEGGSSACITASGMAAVHLVTQLVQPGQLVVATHDCYGGTHRLLSAQAQRGTFRVQFVDFNDAEQRRAALAAGPALVWVETPSNPLLRITDLRQVCREAHSAGALVAVDNTFLSPALQRPIELGADIVVHSTTKYLNGHSDVVGGAVVASSESVGEHLAWWCNGLGLAAAPFDCFLAMRGLRTLHARLRVHQDNTAALVRLLSQHGAVDKLYYPGLPDHPGHDIAAGQQQGFGAMLSFELVGGRAAVAAFVEGLQIFSLAESLGGVESLVAHPATMTHAAMDAEARTEAGIGEGLLRISVGIEDVQDLLADLEAALDRALI